MSPCSETDQRGIVRPQNGTCDTGAFEFVGPPPPVDTTAPDTKYLTGPIQDTLETVAFTFEGSDSVVLRSGVAFAQGAKLPEGVSFPEGATLPAGVTYSPETGFSVATTLPTGTLLNASNEVTIGGTSYNATKTSELMFECRLYEIELTEEPEPIAPWEPIPPEFMWLPCESPFQSVLIEEGFFQFEVRAIDRVGNTDPTPDIHIINGADESAPDTVIVEHPPAVTNSRAATFTFTGTDNMTPPQFFEYECRLDTRDPELWLECFNPALFSNLASGWHTMEVRAYDGAELFDPTPARYTWHVGPLPDGTGRALHLRPGEHHDDGRRRRLGQRGHPDRELRLLHRALGRLRWRPAIRLAQPPVPTVGENARTFIRFGLPNDAPDCELESAELWMYWDGGTPDRTLEVVPVTGTWRESTLTWFNQPQAMTGVTPATFTVTEGQNDGYIQWDVLDQVRGMIESGHNDGWVIRDAHESDTEAGGDQSFASRETPQDPPDQSLPLLVLRFEADPAPAPLPPTIAVGHGADRGLLRAGASPRARWSPTTCSARWAKGSSSASRTSSSTSTATRSPAPTTCSRTPPARRKGSRPASATAATANVVIRNGTIDGFGWGVLLTGGTTHNVVGDPTCTIRSSTTAGADHHQPRGRGRRALRRRRRAQRQPDRRQPDRLQRGRRPDLRRHREQHRPQQRDRRQPRRSGPHPLLAPATGSRATSSTASRSTPTSTATAASCSTSSTENVISGGTLYNTGDAGVFIGPSSHDNIVRGRRHVPATATPA